MRLTITWLARQDARDTRKWVTSSHEARLDMEGPPPSQRALDSLSSVRTNLLLDLVFRPEHSSSSFST